MTTADLILLTLAVIIVAMIGRIAFLVLNERPNRRH